MISHQPRKQRKLLQTAPLHQRRKWMSAHLAENLLLKYDRRGIPVVKGDTVKVMRGNFKGHENKVSHVNIKKGTVEIEGVTIVKADGKKIAKHIHASSLMITKLNLTDKWRRNILEKKLSEEAKREVEDEAEEQVKEQELERQKIEEAKKAAEQPPLAPPAEEQPVEEQQIEEEKTEETPVEEKASDASTKPLNQNIKQEKDEKKSEEKEGAT